MSEIQRLQKLINLQRRLIEKYEESESILLQQIKLLQSMQSMVDPMAKSIRDTIENPGGQK